MKTKVVVATIAMVFGLGLGSTRALAYDLMDAYRDAVASDAQLRSAQAALEAARELVPQARAGLLPQVGASAEVLGNAVDTNMAPSRDYVSQVYAVQLSQPLYRPQNTIAYEQSKLQLEIASQQYELARQDLILRVAEAYFDLLAARDNLRTIQAQKRAIAEQLAAAKRNFEVGTATITDEQEAQARYDLATAQELAAESELEIRRAALALLTGKPVNEVDVVRPGVELLAPVPAQESAWTEAARANAIQVRQALIGADVFRQEIDRRRSARGPTVDLVGQVAHSRNSVSTIPNIRSNSAAIGVQLAIPLYTGGAIEASVREAAAGLAQAEADVEVARRAAEQGSRQAFLGLYSGLAQVRALEAAERSSQLALASNELGYQVGVRINIDVLNAQQQLFTTRRDLLGARYQVLLNGLRLKATTGALDESSLAQVNALLVDPRVAEEAAAREEAEKERAAEAQRRRQMEAVPAPGRRGGRR
jgi:outer membrane protein